MGKLIEILTPITVITDNGKPLSLRRGETVFVSDFEFNQIDKTGFRLVTNHERESKERKETRESKLRGETR